MSALVACDAAAGDAVAVDAVAAAAAAFERDGFVALQRVAAADGVDRARAAALAALAECRAAIDSRGKVLGIGQKGGFAEIVQRHAGRCELRHGMDTGALADLTQTVLASAAFEVARRVLCDDDGADNAVVLGVSCVVASDGCDAQAWHVDGGHVDGAKHLRAHCLNIFVPLVDVSQGGGTEFRPASHFLTRNLQKQMLIARARKTRPGRVRSGPAFAHYCFSLRPPVVPALLLGDAVIFDYRTLHRGTRNTTGASIFDEAPPASPAQRLEAPVAAPIRARQRRIDRADCPAPFEGLI